jgi:hypothetical protein
VYNLDLGKKEAEAIQGRIHSAVTTNFADHLILFDYENAYIFNFRHKDFKVIPNVACISCMNDNHSQAFFALIRCSYPEWANEGMKYLDVEASAKNKEIIFLPLVDCEIGALSFIDLGFGGSRLGFLETLD